MSVLVPILVLGGIGAVLGVGLAWASRVFAVLEDPRVEALGDILPGANCGACGYPGCSGYAKALADGAEVTLCSPGGNATVKDIAQILGVEAVAVVEKVALIKCAGGRTVAPDRSVYIGLRDCKSAVLVSAGNKECRWGCVGFGSCADVCNDNAIGFTDDGLAYVIAENCIACKNCVKACPRDLIEMVPKDRKVHVLCSSQDPGKNTKASCQVGCIACKLCERRDKASFSIVNNNAVVNYAQDGKDVPAAALVCTPGAIWDMDFCDQLPWLTDPAARERHKQAQADFKAAERAERDAAKKKAAAAKAKAAKEETADESERAERARRVTVDDVPTMPGKLPSMEVAAVSPVKEPAKESAEKPATPSAPKKESEEGTK